jgi:hypothetical protein
VYKDTAAPETIVRLGFHTRKDLTIKVAYRHAYNKDIPIPCYNLAVIKCNDYKLLPMRLLTLGSIKLIQQQPKMFLHQLLVQPSENRMLPVWI